MPFHTKKKREVRVAFKTELQKARVEQARVRARKQASLETQRKLNIRRSLMGMRRPPPKTVIFKQAGKKLKKASRAPIIKRSRRKLTRQGLVNALGI